MEFYQNGILEGIFTDLLALSLKEEKENMGLQIAEISAKDDDLPKEICGLDGILVKVLTNYGEKIEVSPYDLSTLEATESFSFTLPSRLIKKVTRCEFTTKFKQVPVIISIKNDRELEVELLSGCVGQSKRMKKDKYDLSKAVELAFNRAKAKEIEQDMANLKQKLHHTHQTIDGLLTCM